MEIKTQRSCEKFETNAHSARRNRAAKAKLERDWIGCTQHSRPLV